MKTRNFILLLVSIFLFYGCSGDLSRSKAKKIILQYLNESIENQTAYISYHYSGYWGETNVIDNRQFMYGELNNLLDAFRAKGLINGDNQHIEVDTKLQQYILGSGTLGDPNKIPVATVNDVEITGITGSNQDTYRRVEYTIIYEWNEIGKMAELNENIKVKKVINFKKYDDGWRIDS